jgi:outer membrane protein OmpA-like peptidoglycan-associated protein
MKVLLPFILFAFLFGACSKAAFTPVNVGREYGNPTMPWVVSHLPEANQWALSRTGHHFFLRKILCFDAGCRQMIGRRKTLRAISFEKYKKRIRKHARDGVYDRPAPVSRYKPDTASMAKKAVRTIPKVIKPIEPVTVVAPVLKADSLIILNEFLFEINSHTLKTEHYNQLDSISNFLLGHTGLEVSVSGHTDNTGNERHNVALSTRRAEVVAEYLISKGTLDERVTYEGLGSSQPIASNETKQGRSKNRRVEILIRNPVSK